jgi:hypothetical protein
MEMSSATPDQVSLAWLMARPSFSFITRGESTSFGDGRPRRTRFARGSAVESFQVEPQTIFCVSRFMET